MTSSRVLITGTSGFIGSTAAERFARGGNVEVVGVDRILPSTRAEGVEYKQVELCDRADVGTLMRGVAPDTVIHLAAQARVEPSVRDPASTYRDNVLATMNLIEAAIGSKDIVRQFVYASSETVYGPARVYPTPESEKPNPQSPYAYSKAATELLVLGALGVL